MESPSNRMRVACPTKSERGQLHLLVLLQHTFPISALLRFRARKLFVVGGCPEYCRTFSSIPDLNIRPGAPTPKL